MYLTISQIHVLPPFKRAKIRSVESVVCALGRRPSAKREGDVAALAATSAKKPPLVITKRTHYSHLAISAIKIYRFLCRITSSFVFLL